MHLLTPRFALLRQPVPGTIANLSFIAMALQLGLPTTIALFPQTASLPVAQLEPKFHDLRDEAGRKIDKVYFNKGEIAQLLGANRTGNKNVLRECFLLSSLLKSNLFFSFFFFFRRLVAFVGWQQKFSQTIDIKSIKKFHFNLNFEFRKVSISFRIRFVVQVSASQFGEVPQCRLHENLYHIVLLHQLLSVVAPFVGVCVSIQTDDEI